jgi:hypothetical protein
MIENSKKIDRIKEKFEENYIFASALKSIQW